jgi:hypothetical protein
MNINLIEAFEVVMQLASENALDERHCDFELVTEARYQKEALNQVDLYIKNLA